VKKLLLIIISLSIWASAFSQTDNIRRKIEDISVSKKATVGVAVLGLENKDTFSINGNVHFPMQSVFKFHIALAVLDAVDKGKFKLKQKIFIKKTDLLPNTWSPLRDKYPNGNVYLTLSEILRYTVSQSDNNGCDILIRLVGGTQVIDNYIHGIGIKDFSIKTNEEEMHKDWNVQFTNWTTPIAAVEALKTAFEKKILSSKSHKFLWKTMFETSTGKNKIKGQLPIGTQVGHKTGYSGANSQGLTAVTNDIGIVTLPNGDHFAISIFVSMSTEKEEVNDRIIADITRAVWDYFINHKK
jgi:beta-lactamase class A